ncbi:hypothetical protein PN465_15715 [Nodularia spumigena CS-584]|nr:RHS repeat-associated core domain-containing protein [Nodularia spumigena]MDB9383652.1 hypothetical protein [Nodularia spumigena CS-584]
MYYIYGIGDACEGHDQGIGTHLASGDPKEYSRTVGDKRYELSNHLGNVLSVITDRKLIGGNVVGETLVYNFTFEGTKDGFEPTSTGSIIPDNSRLAMSANGNNGGAQQLISLVPNKTYMVSFDLERGNYAPSVTADMTYTLNGIVNISGTLTTSASGHQSFMVTLPENAPAAQQLRFRLRQGNYNLWPHVFYVDNVTVTELSNNFTAGLQPDVVEYYDYDPFGMQIAKRSTQLGKYRYGFQGQEKDDELKGDGNSLNYTFRMHDPRVGRFFAVDPLAPKYPFYSPYQFSSNSPIYAIELEGLESSQQTNQNEKPKESAVKTFFGKSFMGLLGVLYNLNEITNGRAPSRHPLDDKDFLKKALEGEKALFNLTFESIGIVETAKFGIGSMDDEISFSIGKSFSSVKKSFSTAFKSRISLPKLALFSLKPSVETVRKNLAMSFLRKFGVSNIENHLRAINFGEEVFTKTYDVGTKFYRYTKKGSTDPRHYFFTEEYTLPGAVGKLDAMRTGDYIIEEYTLTSKVKTLNSTTDLDGQPGNNQVFSTEIEKNSTKRSGAGWGELLND